MKDPKKVVASNFILSALESDKRDATGDLIYTTLGADEKAAIRTHDLAVIRDPYIILGFVVIAIYGYRTLKVHPKK